MVKVYISADLEGITGVSKWEETHKGTADYERYREQMTKEVVAACKGAVEAGADTILVKDAHEDGKNLIHSMLPKEVKVISGWSNHPYNMLEGLDDSFDAVLFIGYHSGASSNGTPLAHTLDPDKIREIYINGERADEFLINAYTAYMLGVPVVAVTGDGELIRKVRTFDGYIKTVAVGEGFGGAVVSIHPELAVERIQKAARRALEHIEGYEMHTQSEYELVVTFNHHQDAYKYSFYPNVEQTDEYTIRYTSNNYMHILTLLMFI